MAQIWKKGRTLSEGKRLPDSSVRGSRLKHSWVFRLSGDKYSTYFKVLPLMFQPFWKQVFSDSLSVVRSHVYFSAPLKWILSLLKINIHTFVFLSLPAGAVFSGWIAYSRYLLLSIHLGLTRIYLFTINGMDIEYLIKDSPQAL